jgi:hypothetical protein
MREALELPHCPVTIEENDIINGAAEVLGFVRPKWKKDEINYKVLFSLFACGKNYNLN